MHKAQASGIRYRSRFSWLYAGLIPLLTLALSLGMGILLAWLAWDEMRSGKPFYRTLIWPALLMGGIGLLALRHYSRLFVRIQLEETGLRVIGIAGHRFWPWTDVQDVKVMGKLPETFLIISLPYEAVQIRLKNNKRLTFFARYYANFHQLRAWLNYLRPQLKRAPELDWKLESTALRSHPKTTIHSGPSTSYGDQFLFSLNLWLMLGLTGFFVYIFASDTAPPSPEVIGVFAILYGLVYFFLGYQTHYFKLDHQQLLVKNHLWFFRRTSYALQDIREVVLEQPYRMPTTLRIIMQDFRMASYPADTLKKKEWYALRDALQKRGIKVRNDRGV